MLWNLGTFQTRKLHFRDQTEGTAKQRAHPLFSLDILGLEISYLKYGPQTSRNFRNHVKESITSKLFSKISRMTCVFHCVDIFTNIAKAMMDQTTGTLTHI